jgi:hypothetical protein
VIKYSHRNPNGCSVILKGNKKMKRVSLAKLMVKAIKQFEKENKTYEIRNVYAWEFGGNSALFHIESVDENLEYHAMQIEVKEEEK